ncbi:protein of unknown function [Xenorhabdus poinarii G6]|uniref:Uncharacterized protein n=1 Tax=Xenorhabdus poinarii G6 TaxID=1354304 RepID=A0A068QZ04_9GAMM|nr:protein of unknown function [Xenorhabdus poinarii G6]
MFLVVDFVSTRFFLYDKLRSNLKNELIMLNWLHILIRYTILY